MRHPSATASALQDQSTQSENHSQAWPEHPAAQFLRLLGKDPGQTYFRTICPGKGANRSRRGKDLHGFDLEHLTRDNLAGDSIYFVTGNSTTASGKAGGVENRDVTSCPALFAEWDDREIEWQLQAWQELGLPEPTIQLLTGGKSVHCYWLLTEAMEKAQWRPLQAQLIDHCGSDQNCKNEARLMRLPGFDYIHKKTGQPNGKVAEVVHTSANRYSPEQIEACLPSLLAPPPAPATTPARGLPHRTLQEIEAAAACIPERVEGGGTYETSRRALCGCAAALAEIGLPEEQALDLLASKWPDRAKAKQVLNSSSTREAASFWAIAKEHGFDFSRRATNRKVVPIRSKRAQQQQQAQGEQEPEQQPEQEPPFRILGWGTKLDAIWVQTGQAGVVASIPPSKNGLQRIAGLPYWEALYPSKLGTNWDSAISSICEQAHDLRQVFTPDRIRGRGVWLDNNRVVWHLGNRLEVEGQPVALTQLQETSWTYASLPALDISPDEKPLTDEEGAAVLDLIHSQMQWTNPGDGLLIAGSIVLGNVCGALDIRPGLQLTGSSGDGKSTAERSIIRPLQGGLGVRPSGATEAGIRQRMQSDALPVVIDESEGEAARQREGHLKLLRLSFDGQEQIRGTAGGQALTYTMRSSITLIGINAAVPNLADRNRLVVVRPRKMPPEQWANFMRQRDALIKVKTGQRLIRRSVTNLKALLANISTFQAVVASTGLADRSAEVYGSLLAGAHHLASTAVLEPQQALAWLDSVGWSGLDEETKEAIASDAEGRACLDHLLGHSVRWKESETGSVDVRELLTMVRCSANSDDAKKALGRLGLKFDIALGLVVSRACTVFAGGRWANGAHHDRLLELKGAAALNSPVRFTGGPSRRGVCIPAKVADL